MNFKTSIFLVFIIMFLLTACGTTLQPARTISPTVQATFPLEPAMHLMIPTSSASAVWSVYHNSQYGFTFEYPTAYEESSYIDSCGIKEDSHGIHLGHQIDLLFIESNGLKKTEYAKNLLQSKGWISDSLKNTTVNGQEAITVEYRFGGTNRFGTFTLIERNHHIFILSFSAGSFCDMPEVNVFEPEVYSHLLATFQFFNTPQPLVASPATDASTSLPQTGMQNTYSNLKYGYSLKYPYTYNVTVVSDEYVEIGDKITVEVMSQNPTVPRGDGSVIESTSDIQFLGYPAKLVTGYIGSIGGYMPQQYNKIVVEQNGNYFVFTLYALGLHIDDGDISQITELTPDDVSLFDNIVASVQMP